VVVFEVVVVVLVDVVEFLELSVVVVEFVPVVVLVELSVV